MVLTYIVITFIQPFIGDNSATEKSSRGASSADVLKQTQIYTDEGEERDLQDVRGAALRFRGRAYHMVGRPAGTFSSSFLDQKVKHGQCC